MNFDCMFYYKPNKNKMLAFHLLFIATVHYRSHCIDFAVLIARDAVV